MIPSSAEILDGLSAVANQWRWLAVVWHILLGGLLLRLALGRRPSERTVGVLLTLPLASVAALAWASGNLFNGAVFSAVSVAAFGLALRLPGDPVRVSTRPLLVAGAVLVAFGWSYPHFLQTDSWASYLYAAPLGLLPCPTLSAIVGVALMFDCLGSRRWATTVAATGIVYGWIGAFGLGVGVDVVLLAGALSMRFAAARPVRSRLRAVTESHGHAASRG